MSKLPRKDFYLNFTTLILALPIVIIAFIYVWVWSQSSFKCLSWTKPILNIFDTGEQYVACRTFADLGNTTVNVTNNELRTVTTLMEKSGNKISRSEAIAYALGRAKISEYADRNNIYVSEKEIDEEVQREIKELGSEGSFLGKKTMAERRMEVKGVLLQKKIEESLVKFVDAEWVALRWDVRLDKQWKPEIVQLRETAKNVLAKAKSSFESGATAEQAQSAAENSGINLSKHGFNLGDRQKLYIDEQTAQPYKKALTAKLGVTDIFCDDRFCVVLKVYESNSGDYDSFDHFLGDLKGW